MLLDMLWRTISNKFLRLSNSLVHHPFRERLVTLHTEDILHSLMLKTMFQHRQLTFKRQLSLKQQSSLQSLPKISSATLNTISRTVAVNVSLSRRQSLPKPSLLHRIVWPVLQMAVLEVIKAITRILLATLLIAALFRQKLK